MAPKPLTIAILASSVMLISALVGCTFDPLENWAAPTPGSFQVGLPDGFESDDPGDAGPGDPPPFRIRAIEPDNGDPMGDEQVTITGVGFVSDIEVFFGDTPGEFAQTHDSETIYVRTPPHSPGVVDVTLVHPDGRQDSLAGGFLFGEPLEIHSIEPSSGATTGGTPVTIRGSGFEPDTVMTLGGRLLIDARRLDRETIVGITPGLHSDEPPGPVDLLASSAFGGGMLLDGFTYQDSLHITRAVPAAGPAAGGNTITLEGGGFGAGVRVWMALHGDGARAGGAHVVPNDGAPPGDFVEAQVMGRSQDGRKVMVQVPAGPPGLLDVAAMVHGEGTALRTSAYSRLGRLPGDGPLLLHGVFPSSGPPDGGEEVLLTVSGLRVRDTPTVHFGDKPATVHHIDDNTGTILVATPGDSPGPVPVSVAVGADESRLPAAYRYLRPLAINNVTPPHGPYEGGTTFTIHGSGFKAPATVRVGGLLATDVRVHDSATIIATTPPGSPGLADVRVTLPEGPPGHRETVATRAFHYTYSELALFTVSPARGSVAGGTYVELFGAGFPARPGVRFGHQQAHHATWLSPTRIVAYTPKTSRSGAVDVAVFGPGGTSILNRGYRYFDPYGSGPGTWGGPIRGAVNATVVQQRTLDPIPNAAVLLDDGEVYLGYTDEHGQVTLSGPELRGPRTVTATALDHDAQSFVGVDAANVILVLTPETPPDSTQPEPGEPLPDGHLGGRVGGAEKYVPIPLVSCDDVPYEALPLCMTCESDDDCRAAHDPGDGVELIDLRCSDLGADGMRCTSACGMGCPEGFTCSRLGDKARCLPSVGKRRTRCEVSKRSIFWRSESPPVEVDPFTGAFMLDTRLGEVAIVCLGGYEHWETGEFIATRMGVRRNVVPSSGDLVREQDIVLDIPLTRTLYFRFDPPLPAEGEPHDARLAAHMVFGSDGVYTLASRLNPKPDGTFVLRGVPASFTGKLHDVTLSLFGGRYTPNEIGTTPYTETIKEWLDDDALAHPQVLVLAPGSDGESERFTVATEPFNHQPLAVHQTTDGSRLVAGEGGLMAWGRPGGSWSVQPFFGETRLTGIDGTARDSIVAVGDGGAIFRFDGLGWRRLDSPTKRDLHAVWTAGPDRFIAVGDHRIVEYDHGEWSVLRLAAKLNAVSGRHWEDVVAVGRDGLMLQREQGGWRLVPSGTDTPLYGVWLARHSQAGFVVGGDGLILQLDRGTWQPVDLAQHLEEPPQCDLRAVHGVEDAGHPGALDLLAVGDLGTALGFDGLRWRRLRGVPHDQMLRAVHRASEIDAESEVFGSWLTAGPRATTLAPILPSLRFEIPQTVDPFSEPNVIGSEPLERTWDGRELRWTIGEGAQARATFINIIGPTGRSRWRLTIPGHLRRVELPDLEAIIGFTPVPATGRLRLRAQAAYWPAFNINDFRNTGISYNDWRSWTYDYLLVK